MQKVMDAGQDLGANSLGWQHKQKLGAADRWASDPAGLGHAG